MSKLYLVLIFSFIGSISFSRSDTTKSLINETMLHPGDGFNAYTLKRGEFAYNQAITPYPSWGWWGITDWCTAELDLEAWLGGVLSFNFRFRLMQQDKAIPGIAFETMYQNIWPSFDQFANLNYLDINRKGSSWYNRVNFSWQVKEKLHLHASAGATYAEEINFVNSDSSELAAYGKQVHPDGSLALDWKYRDWGTFHTTASWGTTFLYADNIPRKLQFTVAGRWAPFIRTNVGILNSFRIETAFLFSYFPDAKEYIWGPIGFVYWQWDWSKENRQRRKKNKTKKNDK